MSYICEMNEKRKIGRERYRKDNVEKIREYQKQYYIDNKERLQKRAKENRIEYRKNNVEKIREYQKQYDKDNSLKRKNSHIKRKYGVTLEEYDLMLNKQGSRCLICNRHQTEVKIPFGVDHDHKTGRIRGLLCNKCNQGLGLFNDDINILLKAIKYLK